MTAVLEPPVLVPVRPRNKGATVVKWLSTTDHKVIGNLYLITAMIFFFIGGALALLIRLELFSPGLQVVQNKEQYNQLFTMHGLIMLLLFATPAFAGWANAIMPLQIGSPDVAFPRLNMVSYWFYAFGGLMASSSFLTPQGAASFGWYMYSPLSSAMYSPGLGTDLVIFGLALGGFSTILGSVNFITTIVCMRAPGMTMFRMPLFTWNILITSILAILAFPPLAVALFGLGADRKLGAQLFTAENGGAMLWQHLFWFFGHPEVYIIALPFFGIVTEIFPVFSRKPIFGYKTLVFATITIAALSASVWAHHMYTTGQVSLPFFAFMTMLIAVPTGVKFFNWIGTMWRGSLSFETPMLWSIGFLATFLFGGLTGIILSTPVLDFQLSDSYFIVAHFHYTVFGTVVFAVFAGFYFWWPKLTGRMLNEKLGKVHFWTTFIGFHTTFLIQHWIGMRGAPRRYADYMPEDGITTLNRVSTVGSLILGASMLLFVYNVFITMRRAPLVELDDPWGYGNSLEWATSCPPPRHNFTSMPRIRSERPAFDLHHPEVAASAEVTPDRLADKALGGPDVKVETWLFGAGAFFFIPLAIVYGFITNWHEPLGVTALVLTGGLAGLIGAYFLVTSRRIDPRPEDDPFGEIHQGAGEQGVFAPYSWAPLWIGIGSALVMAGLAVGWWLFFIGAGFSVFAVILWVFEYYRGEHAH